jgi:phosphatidylglycerol:prolipoprotein diacylglycerol transferase
MSYPYLSDIINSMFGTELHIPIAMFGSFVALAAVTASAIAKSEAKRLERAGMIGSGRLMGGGPVAAHAIVGNLAIICVLWGVVGARLFHILEYPREFLFDPLSMLLSGGGFSIYGGLIVGAVAGALYVRRRQLPMLPMLDAVAPALAAGYGIGRIGCQISGDGDWGIAANMALQPDWLPTWLWAQTYENNIVGVTIASPGVYPTPIYEALMSFIIFCILWGLRGVGYARCGFIFSLYLLLSGFARMLIEKIRINTEYHLFGASFTQAEFISTFFIFSGLIGILLTIHGRYFPKVAFSLFVVGALSACAGL